MFVENKAKGELKNRNTSRKKWDTQEILFIVSQSHTSEQLEADLGFWVFGLEQFQVVAVCSRGQHAKVFSCNLTQFIIAFLELLWPFSSNFSELKFPVSLHCRVCSYFRHRLRMFHIEVSQEIENELSCVRAQPPKPNSTIHFFDPAIHGAIFPPHSRRSQLLKPLRTYAQQLAHPMHTQMVLKQHQACRTSI